jgi:hypothetical protein
VVYDSYGTVGSLLSFHGKAIALDINHEHAPLPLLFLTHEYMVRSRNFYRPMPSMEVSDDWQEWMVEEGVVNESDDGTFTFNRDAPTSGPPARRSRNLQALSTTAVPSGSRTIIMPPTADLVEELMAWQRKFMGWEGMAEENVKKLVENIGVESIE